MQTFLITTTRMHVSPCTHTHTHRHKCTAMYMHLICRTRATSRDRSKQGEAGEQEPAGLLTDRNDYSQNSHGDVVAYEVVITSS